MCEEGKQQSVRDLKIDTAHFNATFLPIQWSRSKLLALKSHTPRSKGQQQGEKIPVTTRLPLQKGPTSEHAAPMFIFEAEAVCPRRQCICAAR
jgi:hypothetical protein